jgi:hypothetical protein
MALMTEGATNSTGFGGRKLLDSLGTYKDPASNFDIHVRILYLVAFSERVYQRSGADSRRASTFLPYSEP